MIKGDLIDEDYRWCYKIDDHNMILVSIDRRYFRSAQKSTDGKTIFYNADRATNILVSYDKGKCTIEGDNIQMSPYTTIYLYNRYSMRMGFMPPMRSNYTIICHLDEIKNPVKFPIDQYENAPLDDVIELHHNLNSWHIDRLEREYFTYIAECLAKLNDERLYQHLNEDPDRYQYCGGGELVIAEYLSEDFDNVKHDTRFIDFILDATDYHWDATIDEILTENENENNKHMCLEDIEEEDDIKLLTINTRAWREQPDTVISDSKRKMFEVFNHYSELHGIVYVVTDDNYEDTYTLLCMIIYGVRENQLTIKII